jgi:hypothetical protein
MCPKANLDVMAKRKIPAGNLFRVVQLVASHYTDNTTLINYFEKNPGVPHEQWVRRFKSSSGFHMCNLSCSVPTCDGPTALRCPKNSVKVYVLSTVVFWVVTV